MCQLRELAVRCGRIMDGQHGDPLGRSRWGRREQEE
jgi:hypothetical protein